MTTALTIERYASPSIASLLRFPRTKAAVVSNVDKPATLTIPAGIDGLLHEREGVLRVVSATEGKDGTRHQYLITYAWNGHRFQILTCNCPCCYPRHATACGHCLAADDALNCPPVKGYLINHRPGQTQPTEMSRSLPEGDFDAAGKFVPRLCGKCGAGHPLRRTNLYFVPLGYLSVLSCPHCGDWRTN